MHIFVAGITTEEQETTTNAVPETTLSPCQSQDLEHCTIWGNALKIDICKNSEIANHLCRHYCGRCNIEITTSSVTRACKDHDVCQPLLQSSFDICRDDKTAVLICPFSCNRCNDVTSRSTMSALTTSPIGDCHDNSLCEPLMLTYNISILCNDKFIQNNICKKSCNFCSVTQATTNSGGRNSGVSGKVTPLSPTSSSSVMMTGASSNIASGGVTLALNITYTGGINNASVSKFASGNVTPSSIITNSGGVFGNSTQNTSGPEIPTAYPVKQCIDRDPNCPYLESTINICSKTNVAMGIGCDLTCGYCKYISFFYTFTLY